MCKVEVYVEKKVKEECMKEELYWKEVEGFVFKVVKKWEEEVECRVEVVVKKFEVKKFVE